jgi:predicted acylesterase/phospholipase RssA
MIPYRIYLSGGGICAMAHVGALVELSKHTPLPAVKEWMGVSAGSFVAMCICIGFTLEELTEISVRFDFTNIKEVDSIPGWILHFGLDTGERLHRMIEACLHVKGLSSDFTFQDCFEQFGLSLRVIATDLNDAVTKIFSPHDTPDYRVVDAVHASMSAPYYFQPFLCPVTGHYLIDGAVISNYPLFVVPEEEHARTLSILIRTSVEKVEELMDLEIDELITRPMNIALREKVNIETKFYDAHCIQIQLGEINILDFSFDEETKNRIIEKGRDAVLEYVDGNFAK